MKKLIFLFALLVAVAAFSGCVQQPPPQYQCADGTWVEDQSLCPAASTGPQGEEPPIGLEDCGSMDNMHLLMVDEQTEEEKVALSCFNEKMLQCSAGELELTGQGGRIVSVEEEEGEFCIMVFSKPSETKTCKIPKTLIADLSTFAEDEGKPETLLIGTAFVMTAGSVENTVTGETVTVECE